MHKFKEPMPHERLKKLSESGTFMDTHETSEDSDFMLKEWRLGEHNELAVGYGEEFEIKKMAQNIEDFLDASKRVGADFVPRTRVIVAKNQEGKDTIYLMTRRIKGQELNKDSIGGSKNENREKILTMLEKTIDIYVDSYSEQTQKGLTVEFIKLQNYIKDEQGKIFLVDLSPVYDLDLETFKMRMGMFLKYFKLPAGEIRSRLKTIEQKLKTVGKIKKAKSAKVVNR